MARLLATLVLAASYPAVATAQTCTTGGGGPPGGGGSNRIAVTPSPTLISFPSPSVPEFQAGRTDYPNPVTVTVQPNNRNKAWNLCIRGSDASPVGNKPVSDLLWSLDGSTWVATTTGDQFIASGQGARTITLYFRMNLAWASDSPGTYTNTLTFTAIHP